MSALSFADAQSAVTWRTWCIFFLSQYSLINIFRPLLHTLSNASYSEHLYVKLSTYLMIRRWSLMVGWKLHETSIQFLSQSIFNIQYFIGLFVPFSQICRIVITSASAYVKIDGRQCSVGCELDTWKISIFPFLVNNSSSLSSVSLNCIGFRSVRCQPAYFFSLFWTAAPKRPQIRASDPQSEPRTPNRARTPNEG